VFVFTVEFDKIMVSGHDFAKATLKSFNKIVVPRDFDKLTNTSMHLTWVP